ncbi:alpha/beta hydrolase [Pseudorhodobacter sp.]|uniref:alpha/beta hydrolase n=1 Tax=Pseudorhodobacter sp. TaxID=1934400 RepID=UPI00264A494D|nr:alpha/beta hydrolase [Pseudorhodobacter sp.]MDN5788452.1 alpha/beta hydrolase [Pseudorhodobacter sp.]
MSAYDPKYDALIDAQTWAFIRETESWYPPDAVDLTIVEQRAVYNRMCKAFHAGHPAGVVAKDDVIAGQHNIPVRRYTMEESGAAQVVYLHGGGFVVGGLESHDDVCAEICAGTGFDVTSVDYRLSPEHPFPQDYEDALAAAQHQAAGKPLVLVGDSAGGNLCAAVAAACAGHANAPVGQVIIYPVLGTAGSTPSAAEHAFAPMLTAAGMAFYAKIRSDGRPERVDGPRFSPLRAQAFAGLPPTIAISAECDPLADDAALYCQAINAAGGRALHIREAGLVHGYLRARHRADRAGRSFARILKAVSTLGQRVWPDHL